MWWIFEVLVFINIVSLKESIWNIVINDNRFKEGYESGYELIKLVF